MKLFDSNTELTELAKLIMSEDIIVLEKLWCNGFDINSKFSIAKGIEETPIILALSENKKKVIDWLLSNNVELNNKEYPAILMACSSCSSKVVKLLIDNGADVNAKHRIGSSAMSDALYGKNYDAVSLLIERGYDIKRDGTSLRQAVSDRQYKAIAIFLNHGVNVNFCKPNMVYPYNPTPVHVAAENNDFKTVKLLVEHGADVTIKDKYGERPYHCAEKNKNEEMIQFIKSLEPKQWHNEEQRLIDLKSYKIPAELLDFLRGDKRRIEIHDNPYSRYIVFNSLLELKEVKWEKRKLIDLIKEVDNYDSEGFLVWYPKNKMLAFADYEHGEFVEICNVKEFLDNPSKQIAKIFEYI